MKILFDACIYIKNNPPAFLMSPNLLTQIIMKSLDSLNNNNYKKECIKIIV